MYVNLLELNSNDFTPVRNIGHMTFVAHKKTYLHLKKFKIKLNLKEKKSDMTIKNIEMCLTWKISLHSLG